MYKYYLRINLGGKNVGKGLDYFSKMDFIYKAKIEQQLVYLS